MLFWETLGPGIDMDVTLERITYVNIVAEQIVFSSSKITHPDTLQKPNSNALRNITKSSRCCRTYQTNINKNPPSQLTGHKRSAANLLLPDDTAHLQTSGEGGGTAGQNRFGSEAQGGGPTRH